MNKLEGWVFTYNSYDKTWGAVKRDDYNHLFNNFNSSKVLRSSKIETLIDIICRTLGDKDKINDLTKVKFY